MRRPAPPHFRVRSFEHLEARCLLAADACQDEDGLQEVADPVAGTLLAADPTYYASDAGSTTRTAYDLGELGATLSLNGSVGGYDPSDVLRFTLSTASQVNIDLTGLRSDIDLYLFNAQGQPIAVSNKYGSASESLSPSLDAGTYYILVVPWRRASSTYVLTVGATSTTTPDPTQDLPTSDPSTGDPTTGTSDPTSDPLEVFPDVAYYGGSNEWNLNAINAPESWAQGYTGDGVVVAVVDTGVDLNHPDLVNQIWVNAGEIPGNGIDDDHNGYIDDVSGWDFASGDNNPNDGNGHGTHVAGTIAAEANGTGATGVAPDATIMPVRVLGGDGSGTAAGVAAGIRYAVDMGADIINLSLGGGYSSVILSAIEYALRQDVLVVAAAGNDGASTPGYPARFSASLSNVISVGAYSSSGTIANFSNDVGGSGAVQVDAPGVNVYSTYVGNRYGRLSGTSMATPHVAGLAALALSANPSLTASQLRSLIVGGANDAIAGSDSAGGINAAVTVALAAAGQTSASSTTTTQAQPSGQAVTASRLRQRSVESAGIASALAASGDTGSLSARAAAASASQSPTESPLAARDTALLAVDLADAFESDELSAETDSTAIADWCLDEILGPDVADWLNADAELLPA